MGEIRARGRAAWLHAGVGRARAAHDGEIADKPLTAIDKRPPVAKIGLRTLS
jgi:hypothetical protein